ncbi:MAG: AMP-binding protein [Planctomycetota bacterium]
MAESVAAARQHIVLVQDGHLRDMLSIIVGRNQFYSARLRAAGLDSTSDRADFLACCPFTTKAEIVADQQAHPPFGTNLTWPMARYVRFSQTSGTNGAPLRWMDTLENWTWMLDSWDHFFNAYQITSADRIFAAFSFGPFLGFWTAYEAAVRRGCLSIPGGGLGTRSRLEVMRDTGSTVLLATPTYVIRMGEAARDAGIAVSTLRYIIVGGEPGGSIPATRDRIKELWPSSQLIDHHGMTEIGPVSWQNPHDPRYLHIYEDAYIVEIIDPSTGAAANPGTTGELVLTNLGRTGSPLLRYRTGDLVRATTTPLNEPYIALDGGILGRVDDMAIVRGVNVWPAAIEAIVRRFPEVAEYRCLLSTDRGMTELRLVVELIPGVMAESMPNRIRDALATALALRIPVDITAAGTLPRPEMKSQRWLRV